MRRHVLLVVAVLGAAGVGTLVLAGRAPSRAARRTADPARTNVARHVEEAIVAGRNLLWCASVQAAWDALADALGEGGRLSMGAPARAEDVAAMNRGRLASGVLPPTTAVAAGRAGDPKLARALQDVERVGGETAALDLRAQPGDVVVAAALAAECPFPTPFFRHERGMRFAGGKDLVATFGFQGHGPLDARRFAQVTVHRDARERPEEGAVLAVLATRTGDRVLLLRAPRPATLDAGWAETRRLLATKGHPAGHGDDLFVPCVHARVDAAWDDWAGAPLTVGDERMPFRRLAQRTDLSLDEYGASVRSTAGAAVMAAVGLPLRFDVPFLLALARPGAERPYLLVWFENDDLFARAP